MTSHRQSGPSDQGNCAGKGVFLLVEDDPLCARSIARQLKSYRPVRTAETLAEARQLLDEGLELAGVVLDVRLPDGSGLELLDELREERPLLPVMVLTVAVEREVVNQAQALRAEFVCKPASRANIDAFAGFAAWAEQLPHQQLAHIVQQLAKRHDLTPREAELVTLGVRGIDRAEMAAALDLAPGTIKAHIRALLGKTRERSLGILAQRVLRAAWRGSLDD